MSETKQRDIQKLIEYLQGTCVSLSEACTVFGFEQDDLTEEECECIDMEVFNCETCGWWYEICEKADSEDGGEQVCDDCYNEE